jgi:hypothetical protein
MSHFQEFERQFGPATNCERVDDGTITKYAESLPNALLEHWRDAGWCAYGGGLLWVTNPAEFEDPIEEWVEASDNKPVVFLRTAFAHLYFWQDGYVHSLDVLRGGLSQVTKDVARIFDLLCNPQMQEKILRRTLFEEAKKRLGPPDRHECYAFEPALALGGPGTVETINRVSIREHLSILAQLNR